MADDDDARTGDDDNKPAAPADGTDWKAEARKWEKRAKENSDAAKTARTELERLKADSDASKGELDKLREQVAEIQEAHKQAQREALVARVAHSKGLTPGQAARLRGDSQEDLEADADQFLADIQAPPKDAPKVTPEPSGGADTTDYGSVADEILR